MVKTQSHLTKEVDVDEALPELMVGLQTSCSTIRFVTYCFGNSWIHYGLQILQNLRL
jgi:hypothetical protein